ncbi:MAG: hypothetical protein EAZ57_10045 [Cytophagales bacterium]|nr:MAG: hypothetical protein EAZ67_10425 [Cytophagales bacterium]TAF59782.1 MAG: hypothetical protein EAZ57_10045 [Cytophagales bacterium]
MLKFIQKRILLLCLLIFSLCSFMVWIKPVDESSGINGKWVGFLWQNQNGLADKYIFEMVLEQKGDSVTGSSLIRLIDMTENYGELELKGTFKKNILKFTEIKIKQQEILMNAHWCKKKGTLELINKSQQELKGSWNGCRSDTQPEGEISLKRLP